MELVLSTNFNVLNSEDLEQIQGESIWSDLGYAVGYGLHGAYEGAKTIVSATKEAVNPWNYVNHFYPGLQP
ncbi:hypothetical protein [Paenibacillus wynnii]|uniref:Bacteriocin n=1 Tax=Paenibacillus wynnii TaxID=268407 RepID=A0A098MEJ2_9BACL|nr:hypothetical protein [Paenibacillus wynnii]KGE20463.1 hypothetical protein PWYN_14780 [Paenibacillus wynnii]